MKLSISENSNDDKQCSGNAFFQISIALVKNSWFIIHIEIMFNKLNSLLSKRFQFKLRSWKITHYILLIYNSTMLSSVTLKDIIWDWFFVINIFIVIFLAWKFNLVTTNGIVVKIISFVQLWKNESKSQILVSRTRNIYINVIIQSYLSDFFNNDL